MACASFMSQNYGAGKPDRVKKSYFISLAYGFGVGLVLGVVLVGSGVVDLVVGALGLRGARDPRKVKPFFVLCVIGLAIEVAGDVWLAAQGMLSSIGASGAVELLVIGACTWLAYDIMRQSRGIEA